MNTEHLLSVREVAAILGLKPPTVYKKIGRRELAFVKPGGPRGRVLFRREDLESFIASRRVPSYDEAAKARRQAGQLERPALETGAEGGR